MQRQTDVSGLSLTRLCVYTLLKCGQPSRRAPLPRLAAGFIGVPCAGLFADEVSYYHAELPCVYPISVYEPS